MTYRQQISMAASPAVVHPPEVVMELEELTVEPRMSLCHEEPSNSNPPRRSGKFRYAFLVVI